MMFMTCVTVPNLVSSLYDTSMLKLFGCDLKGLDVRHAIYQVSSSSLAGYLCIKFFFLTMPHSQAISHLLETASSGSPNQSIRMR
jgi:hypothetical protein